MVQMVSCNLAALTIAMIYYAWRDNRVARARQRTVLSERVAYMLWAAAERAV